MSAFLTNNSCLSFLPSVSFDVMLDDIHQPAVGSSLIYVGHEIEG